MTTLRHLHPPLANKSYAQALQDTCVAHFYRGSSARRYYVDLAANDAIEHSNTYLLDRVFGWRGLCIEPQARYLPRYHDHRTCTLASTVVSPNASVEFAIHSNGGLSGVRGYGNHRRASETATQGATRLDAVFALADVPSVIDYMSLDIEGYERAAMETFPFQTHAIRILTVERPGKALHQLLVDHHMCVTHNNAQWTDLFYINRTLWTGSYTPPAKCHQYPYMPHYVAAFDLCVPVSGP